LILADPEKDDIKKIYRTLEELRKEFPWKNEETNVLFVVITKRVSVKFNVSVYHHCL